ncbi:uncharacterized protein Triagg1_5719 [Trichoderma aggressivum f. europaeum]|uniref:Uncharacterized protein n=1 Tax=Trichoderma aggressivum f. europaeum TaxID=173218 RepID=A0AAE1ICG9_9HYPO|nr:hypothetical protein Triagg1_5719 [Trichoderma aggressivum f. europaeum]
MSKGRYATTCVHVYSKKALQVEDITSIDGPTRTRTNCYRQDTTPELPASKGKLLLLHKAGPYLHIRSCFRVLGTPEAVVEQPCENPKLQSSILPGKGFPLTSTDQRMKGEKADETAMVLLVNSSRHDLPGSAADYWVAIELAPSPEEPF